MILIDNRNTTDPYLNLALEEYLVRNADCSASDYLLLYINEASFVLGKNQSIYKEVNFDYLRSDKVRPARRISGGGTVYHDSGNLNFCFISKFEEHKVNNYKWFNEKLLAALRSKGVDAAMDERNNIVCDGKKISGGAQFTNRKNIISHGTLLFNADLKELRNCLKQNHFEVSTKAVKSIPSPVRNICDVTGAFRSIGNLKEVLISELTTGNTKRFENTEWNEIEKLAKEKYASFNWVFGRSPDTIIKKNGFEIEVKEGLIYEIKQLESESLTFLKGCKYSNEGIENALASYTNGSDLASRLF